ncbi:MAG: hypothetical protein ACRC31_06645, partial [Cetobacterium sp.]
MSDFISNLLQTALKLWNIYGFVMLHSPNFTSVVYRKNKPNRVSDFLIVFKIPVIEKVMYLPKGIIIANPKNIQVGRSWLPLVSSYDICIQAVIKDPIMFLSTYYCYSNDSGVIGSGGIEEIIGLSLKPHLYENLLKTKTIGKADGF